MSLGPFARAWVSRCSPYSCSPPQYVRAYNQATRHEPTGCAERRLERVIDLGGALGFSQDPTGIT